MRLASPTTRLVILVGAVLSALMVSPAIDFALDRSVGAGSVVSAQQPSSGLIPPEIRVRLTTDSNPTPWYRDWKILVAIVGWALASTQLWWSTSEQRRERTRQHLLDSLKWFGGETQPRSIGIAVVEANWDHHPFMHPYWTAVLSTQAIHLLARSKEENSRVEESNLARIMTILTRPDAQLTDGDRGRLRRVLNERKNGVRLASGGINLDHLSQEFQEWSKHFR